MEHLKRTSSRGGGSNTYTMEMQPPPSSKTSQQNLAESSQVMGRDSPSISALDTPPEPEAPAIVLQRWNEPRVNIVRVFSTFYSFMILGANDGAYGALIPYIQKYYGIDYIIVSLVFLSSVVGYVASSLLNNPIHLRFGQRGIAVIMSVSHIIAYTLICLHVPYPALVISFIVAGFGNGVGDAAWNAWVGDMANNNEILGFLHAFYGLGAAISPLIATTIVTKAHWHWYEFYYIMVGSAVIELIVLTLAFRTADAAYFVSEHPLAKSVSNDRQPRPSVALESGTLPIPKQSVFSRAKSVFTSASSTSPQDLSRKSKSMSTTRAAITSRITLLTSTFLLLYVGIEVSIGGWIVTFMLRIRHGSPFSSGLVSTGFWSGVTIGRLILGFVTPRLFPTPNHAVATYLAISVAVQLMFWLIPSFTVSAVMVSLLGFFLAPLFPAAVVVLTKLLPKQQHVPAVGFAAALGASGACVFPFAVGAIANKKGVKVLEPIILAMLVACLGVWLCIPRLPKQRMA